MIDDHVMKNIQALQLNLKYTFRDTSLLVRALRHSSVAPKVGNQVDRSFDRLEFLGDRVLNLIVAEFLYKHFDKESEGDLAHRYSALVCSQTCADVARRVKIDEYLDVATGTSFDDLRILCDALEAVVAAMYLDGGYEPCKTFVERNWRDLFFSSIEPPSDPKSVLQELIQSKGCPLPEYVVMNKAGSDHSPTFTVSVTVPGWAPVTGVGQSKKAAEKEAASKLLILMQYA
ncbi:MAG: ribonuclease III [Holosporales bacterium]|jgi:ribonuclease-3|nr:ribonuclease III [Holosporales bacterium]